MSNYRKTMSQALQEMYPINEDNIDLMRKAAGGAAQTVKMKDGKLKMDMFTASAIMQILDKVNPANKKKMTDMINKGTKDGMMKLQDFAMKQVKSENDPEIEEEVDLDEGKMKDLLIKAQELMGPSKNRKEGIQMVAKGLKVSEKEATKLVDAAIKMNEELAKIKGNTPADKGRRSAVEDDIERAEKKGDKKEVEKLKEVDLDEKEYKVTNDKLGVWTGTAHSEEDAKEKALKKWSVVGNVEFTKDTTVEIIEEEDLDEGKMSQLHQYIKDKKSAEEIAKLMKVDVKTIKTLMSSNNPEDVEESAASDARRAMAKDKDFSRKDSADDDDDATDDDVKGASKNIIMQMRKAQSLNGRFPVEFADKKKVKIPAKMAIAVQQKYNAMKKPADKEKFQTRIGKSYKDMLSALKEELQPKKESILERMNRKIKENKDG